MSGIGSIGVASGEGGIFQTQDLASQRDSIRGFFSENGYVVIRGMYQLPQIECVRAAVEEYSQKLSKSDQLESRFVLEESPDGKRFVKYLSQPTGCIYECRKLLNTAVFQAVGACMDDMYHVGDDLHQKHPLTPQDIVPAHQDSFLLGTIEPHDALTVWVALDLCDAENGALQVVARSHKGPVLDHVLSDHSAFSATIQPDGLIPAPLCSLTCMPVLELGDVLVFHGNTIHHSGPNRHSERWRRGISLRFRGPRYAVKSGYEEEYRRYLRHNRKITASRCLSTEATYVAGIGREI